MLVCFFIQRIGKLRFCLFKPRKFAFHSLALCMMIIGESLCSGSLIEPPCTAKFIWEEQGFFEADIQTSYNTAFAAEPDLANYFTTLSAHGWSGCAAPLMCVACEGLMPENPQGTPERFASRRIFPLPCKQSWSTWELFLHTAQCSGHSNCAGGSDEVTCETLGSACSCSWFI